MNKKMNKKGFTIMEMLIVVAIIAVLVAIAIPTFNGALTKAKEATDVANIRAAYAEVMVDYLTADVEFPADKTAAETLIEGKLDNALNNDTLKVEGDKTTGYTITYTASKLTATDGTKVFEWTMEPYTIG